jgi:CheY-like chemotaxis protein
MHSGTHAHILLVEDDPHLLSALKRTLRQFSVRVATNAAEALDMVREDRGIAVCVADMHMPGMTGLRLLARLREEYPEIVRIMLTGDSDVKTAMQAVNEGQIFRFLSKPCPTTALVNTLTAALEQHRLIVAERQLLEQTLHGTVRLLTEVLSAVNPAVFSRSIRIRKHVVRATRWLQLRESWQYEVAAMLCHLGCISLTPEILEAVEANRELSPEDQQRYAAHASVAHDLLVSIPRLETVARMIARQHVDADSVRTDLPLASRDAADIGGAMLRVAIEIERLESQGLSEAEAVARLRSQPELYDLTIVTAFACSTSTTVMQERRMDIADVRAGMIVADEVRTTHGLLLAARGQELTDSVLLRLQNFGRLGAITSEINVLDDASPEAHHVG